jgi:hypothetical protein
MRVKLSAARVLLGLAVALLWWSSTSAQDVGFTHCRPPGLTAGTYTCQTVVIGNDFCVSSITTGSCSGGGASLSGGGGGFTGGGGSLTGG